MPLSDPAPREEIHLRRVECRGYRRADGLWDIEGRITDTKTYGFNNELRGRIEPGDPVHDMWIRLTIDEELTVVSVEAKTDSAPFALCPDVAPNYAVLAGLRIGSGWTKAVKERLGGINGCTHLVELLGPVATTAFQTIYPLRERERIELGLPAPRTGKRPPIIDTCHALRADGPIVKKRWPEFYTGR
jgi:Protein of unknown function (DUF2889)